LHIARAELTRLRVQNADPQLTWNFLNRRLLRYQVPTISPACLASYRTSSGPEFPINWDTRRFRNHT
jgi:hypothetical protein